MLWIGGICLLARRFRPVIVDRNVAQHRSALSREEGKASVAVSGNDVVVSTGDTTHTFTMDFALPPRASQQDVFETIGVPALDDVLAGSA